MTNKDSDLLPQTQSTRYYILNGVPENTLIIKAEYFDKTAEETTPTKSSEKKIMFALGIIATLTVLSVFQLYRSLEVIQPNPEVTKSRGSSISDTEKSSAIPGKQFNSLESH
ncbi:MAG: hypothetical protein AB4206_18215 [Xenococcaceae cyanobacterium]